MSDMIICNHADDPLCPGCGHDSPHEKPTSNDEFNCTRQLGCEDGDGNELFKVHGIDMRRRL